MSQVPQLTWTPDLLEMSKKITNIVTVIQKVCDSPRFVAPHPSVTVTRAATVSSAEAPKSQPESILPPFPTPSVVFPLTKVGLMHLDSLD